MHILPRRENHYATAVCQQIALRGVLYVVWDFPAGQDESRKVLSVTSCERC
jgi:hypothetical protein